MTTRFIQIPAEQDQYCKFIHPCIIFSHKTREMTTAVSRKLVLHCEVKHRWIAETPFIDRQSKSL